MWMPGGILCQENCCITVHIRMPALTAFDLQEQLASQGIRIPVIAVSAFDDTATRERARELGAVAFFRKPLDDQALLDAIRSAIGETKKDSGK
jgi:FixJ family two-component response regulator